MLRDCILVLIVAFIACLLCVKNSYYLKSIYKELLSPNHWRRFEIVEERETLDMFPVSFWEEWELYLVGIAACIFSFTIGWSVKNIQKLYKERNHVSLETVSLKQQSEISKRFEEIEARISELETRLSMKCLTSEVLYSRDYDESDSISQQIRDTSQHTPLQNVSFNFLDSTENLGYQDNCGAEISRSSEFGSPKDAEENLKENASGCFQDETEHDIPYVKRVQTQVIKPQTNDLADKSTGDKQDTDQDIEENRRKASSEALEITTTEQSEGFVSNSNYCNNSTATYLDTEVNVNTCWYSETEKFYEGLTLSSNMSGDDTECCTEVGTDTCPQEIDINKCSISDNFVNEEVSVKPLKTNHSTKINVVDVCPVNPIPDSARSEGWGETTGKSNQRRRIPQFQKPSKEQKHEVRSSYEKDYMGKRMTMPTKQEQHPPEIYTNPRNSPTKTYRPMSATNEVTETTTKGQRKRRPKTSSAVSNT